MRRRTLLAAVGAGLLPFGGCLSATEDSGTEPPTESGTEAEGRRYEACSREVIPYEQFPEDVQAEIDVAIDSRYEADRVYLREAMDVDESYLSVDDTYYDPSVAVETDRERLTLQIVEPKALPKPRPVSVEQHRDGERAISVRLTAEDRTVLVDETRAIRPGGDVEFGRTRRVGTHELRISVIDGDETEDEIIKPVRIDQSRFSVLVIVGEDEITLTGAVAELGICQYETDAPISSDE